MKIYNLQTFYVQGLREAPTIAKLIDPLLKNAGFDTEDIDSVEEEYSVRTNLGTVEIDKCLKCSGKPYVFLQAKPIGKTHLFKIDYKKTFEAAFSQGIPYAVFTDGVLWEFYSVFQSSLTIHPQMIWQVNLLYDSSKHSELVQKLQSLTIERNI